MEMETRRIRRFVSHHQRRNNTLLPLHTPSSSSNHLSNTISFFYCDYKFTSFNKPLFNFGRKYSNFFRLWFSIGLGFALSAMLAVTLVMVWELAIALNLCGESNEIRSIISELLFGFPHLLSGFTLSFADAGYICISTIISVFLHEFGHALAAASSEGIQIEYIAIFIALLFPGALVAFNDELLPASQHLTSLRVYSAGIWHNAVEITVVKVTAVTAMQSWAFRIENLRVKFGSTKRTDRMFREPRVSTMDMKSVITTGNQTSWLFIVDFVEANGTFSGRN
ncbi:hypothetical protein TSUD_190090 [Trifolium subterraneum]|uniref:Endopeptidase S2P n=1 Tax=Trifolium subterraneum TaxID=3900 RepID=A0A2Z6NWF1_TRISU|nr:hypothetical protein TSUD_190090 [Trifolium subterraneum]